MLFEDYYASLIGMHLLETTVTFSAQFGRLSSALCTYYTTAAASKWSLSYSGSTTCLFYAPFLFLVYAWQGDIKPFSFHIWRKRFSCITKHAIASWCWWWCRRSKRGQKIRKLKSKLRSGGEECWGGGCCCRRGLYRQFKLNCRPFLSVVALGLSCIQSEDHSCEWRLGTFARDTSPIQPDLLEVKFKRYNQMYPLFLSVKINHYPQTNQLLF